MSAKAQRTYRLRHPEKVKVYAEQYRKTESFRAAHRRYREKNRELLRKQSAEYSRTLIGKWTGLKATAKQRGIPCTLSFEEFAELAIPRQCHYCDGPIGRNLGLDRKDSKRGYEKDNVVSCCWPCNAIKSAFLSYEEMLEIRPILIRAKLRREGA